MRLLRLQGCRVVIYLAMVTIVVSVWSSWASEYEFEGTINEKIFSHDANKVLTNKFTVYVRDCSWMIRTVSDVGKGMVQIREVGSTDGKEIHDYSKTLKISDVSKSGNLNVSAPTTLATFGNPSSMNLAIIYSKNMPVGNLYNDMVGHLWLMFASQCYWKSLDTNTTLLTTVYDWKTSSLAGQDLKVPAEWELLNGPGSLPREVRYLGQWDETNGFYKVTGSKAVGAVLVPNGFTFEERHASYITHKMELDKRVEAEVTSVRSVCSLPSLLPIPIGRTIVIDERLAGGSAHGGKYSDYMFTGSGKWPSLEDARKLAEAHRIHQLNLSSSEANLAHRPAITLIVMCIFLAGPPIIYFTLQRSRKS